MLLNSISPSDSPFKKPMATPSLLRTLPLLCRNIRLYQHHHHTLTATIFSLHRTFCSTHSEEDTLSSSSSQLLKPPKLFQTIDDLSYRKWKDKEDQILKDIQPVILLAKEILHSNRYSDVQRLTSDDEKTVVERLLAYHPRSEDKIGCGLDSIMVDRHPQFRQSRCLFVVRTDGGWIDFSYQKCLRQYIRNKYPSHAERFIWEHLKRGSV